MTHSFSLGRLARHLATGATLACSALVAQTAYASVVVVDFSGNALSTVPFNIDGVYLNVVTGAASTTSSSGYDINPYFSGTGGSTPLFRFLLPSSGGIVGAAGIATTLSGGSVVDSSSSFISGVSNATQATAGTNYFGFKFLNESTGGTDFGYLTVQQTSGTIAAGTIKILGYAYENTGLGITIPTGTVTPPVPEPETYALLIAGLGVLGFVARRRRSAGAVQR